MHNDKNTTTVIHVAAESAARITIDYYLDTARLVSDLVPGDALTALVFLTIVSRMLRQRENAEAGLSDKRTAVTVYAVAKDLGLSYETVRRHVKRLLGAGLCERDETGLTVSDAVFARSDFQRAISRNLENVQAMVRRLGAVAP